MAGAGELLKRLSTHITATERLRGHHSAVRRERLSNGRADRGRLLINLKNEESIFTASDYMHLPSQRSTGSAIADKINQIKQKKKTKLSSVLFPSTRWSLISSNNIGMGTFS